MRQNNSFPKGVSLNGKLSGCAMYNEGHTALSRSDCIRLLLYTPKRVPPPPRATPRYTPQAGVRKFKTTLAGMNAKVKDNENLVRKAGNIKHWCRGRKKEVGLTVDPAGTPRVPPGGGGTLQAERVLENLDWLS